MISCTKPGLQQAIKHMTEMKSMQLCATQYQYVWHCFQSVSRGLLKLKPFNFRLHRNINKKRSTDLCLSFFIRAVTCYVYICDEQSRQAEPHQTQHVKKNIPFLSTLLLSIPANLLQSWLSSNEKQAGCLASAVAVEAAGRMPQQVRLQSWLTFNF